MPAPVTDPGFPEGGEPLAAPGGQPENAGVRRWRARGAAAERLGEPGNAGDTRGAPLPVPRA